MKRWSTAFVSGLLTLALAACGGAATPSAQQPAAKPSAQQPAAQPADKEPIKVAMVAALTGPSAVGDKYGFHGVELAIKHVNAAGGINGRPLQLLKTDTGDNTATAVNGLKQVLREKPTILITTNVSPVIFALSPEIKKAEIPTLIAGSANGLTKQGIPWLFRIRPTNNVVATVVANYAVDELKAKKIGVLYVQGDFGQDGFKVIENVLKSKGMAPAKVETHDPNAKDFSAQLLSLKNAGVDLIIGWTNPVPHATIMKQRKQLGINIPYLGSPAASLPSTLELISPEESEGVLVATEAVPTQSKDDRVQKWVAEYKAEFQGEIPEFTAGSYYDGMMMMAEAMKKAGTNNKAIADAMRATKGYKGVVHTYSFDQDGDGVYDAVVTRVRNRQLEVLKSVSVQP